MSIVVKILKLIFNRWVFLAIGILALDRASGVDPFAFRSEWEKVHKPGERYGPPKPREV